MLDRQHITFSGLFTNQHKIAMTTQGMMRLMMKNSVFLLKCKKKTVLVTFFLGSVLMMPGTSVTSQDPDRA